MYALLNNLCAVNRLDYFLRVHESFSLQHLCKHLLYLYHLNRHKNTFLLESFNVWCAAYYMVKIARKISKTSLNQTPKL